MEISNNSYTGFWGNPELSRIEKLKGIQVTPERKAMPLQIGTAFHLICQAFVSGWTEQGLNEAFEKECLSAEAITEARRLFPVMRDGYLVHQRFIGSEVEYKVPLLEADGSESGHYLTGRIDALAYDVYERIKMPEFKSASERTTKWEFETEWRSAPKVCFDLIGAHYLGYKAEYMEIVPVKKTHPPVLLAEVPTKTAPKGTWNDYGLEERRRAYDLQYLMRSVLKTAKVMTYMEREFGIEQPWPHVVHSKWKSSQGACNSISDTFACPFRDICGTSFEGVPEGFCLREAVEEVEAA